MGLQNLEDSQRVNVLKSIGRLPFVVLQRRAQAGFSARFAGAETVDGKNVDLLSLAVDGDTIRYAIDRDSGRIVRATYRGKGPSGEPGEIVSFFSDFKEAGGLTLPFKTRQTFGGEPLATSEVQEIVVNAPVDDSQFARPIAAASAGGGK